MNKISFWNRNFNLNNLQKKLTKPVKDILKNNKKSIKIIKNNYQSLFILIISIYVYNYKPEALLGLLSHSFSLLVMCGLIFYSIYKENVYMAISQVLLLIVVILCKQTAETRKIFKNIENREFFEDGDAEPEEEEDGDDDDDEEEGEGEDEEEGEGEDGDEEDEEGDSDGEEDEEEDSEDDKEEDDEEEDSDDEEDDSDDEEDDSDSDDDSHEGFLGNRGVKTTNLNDTFKNLHDAIHNLEAFVEIDHKH